MALSIIISTALYIFVTLLSVTAYPPAYSNWFEYISDLGNLSGLEAVPAFYAASYYLGNTGTILLFCSLFALISTSLIANLWALSRMIHVIGQDSILPKKLAKLNKKQIPANAILFVGAISLFILFLGRSAIGWIVDVTTIIAIFLYGFVATAAMKCAKQDEKWMSFTTGLAVLIAMVVFGVLMVLPITNAGSLSSETYLLFIVWSVLGMFFFHHVISKDKARHFGKAMVVWVVMISVVFMLGIVWMEKIEEETAMKAINDFHEYHDGIASEEIMAMSESEYLAELNAKLNTTNTVSFTTLMGLFVISIGGFLSNYFSMKKYENALKDDVEQKNQHIVQLLQSFVVGILTMIESRDNSTGGHIKRTSDVVQILVDEMKEDSCVIINL